MCPTKGGLANINCRKMGKSLGHSTLQYYFFSVETEDKTIDSEEDEKIDNGDSYELEEEFGDDYVEVEYSGTKDVATSESRSLPEAEPQPGEDYMDAVKPKTYDHKPKSYRAPKTYDTPKPYKAPKTYEAPKTYDAPKTYQAPKTYKSPKTYGAPKTYETTPKTYEAPKTYETTPKTYEAPKTYDAPKTYETPKPYKAPKTYQTPKPYGTHKH